MLVQGALQQQASEPDLREGDQAILDYLSKSGVGLSFQGIRRGMGIHQETLARSLKRLVDQGLVIKQKNVYSPAYSSSEDSANWYVLIESVLPFDVDPSKIASSLSAKWFSDLRWFGSSDDGSRLVWTTSDGKIKIRLEFVGNEVLVETDAYGEGDLSTAIRYAHTLFDQVAKTLSGRGYSAGRCN